MTGIHLARQISVLESVAKSINALNHKGTKEDCFRLPSVAQTSPEKTLCLRVFVVQHFFAFFDNLLLYKGSGI